MVVSLGTFSTLVNFSLQALVLYFHPLNIQLPNKHAPIHPQSLTHVNNFHVDQGKMLSVDVDVDFMTHALNLCLS